MKKLAKGLYVAVMVAAALAYIGWLVVSTNEMIKPDICECVDYTEDKVTFRMKAGNDSFCGVLDFDDVGQMEQKGKKYTFAVSKTADKVTFTISNRKGKQVAQKQINIFELGAAA